MNKKTTRKYRFAALIAAALLFGAGYASALAQDVIRFDAEGNQQTTGNTVSSVMANYADGDRIVIYNNVNSGSFDLTATGPRKTITFESSDPATVRSVDVQSKRFMDYGFGTFVFKNVQFKNGLGANGGIFCRWSGDPQIYYQYLIGENAEFFNCTSPGNNYGGVSISNPGMYVEGEFRFTNNSAQLSGGALASSAASGPVANGGYIVFQGDNSNMVFSGNTGNGLPNDVFADRLVTIQDAGTYSFGGGIKTATLNVSDAAVTFGTGSITEVTNFNVDDAHLTFAVNNNNIVSSGTTAFSSGATAFTVSGAVQVTDSTKINPIIIDLVAVTNSVSTDQELLVISGNSSAWSKPIIQSSGSTNSFAYLKSSSASGLTVGIQNIEAGKTLYRYDATNTLKASGTDFNSVGWATNNTYVLTGDATFTSQFNSFGLNITIQSDSDEIRKITATGSAAERKRMFDFGYGTYTLSNVEFNNIGLSNDMGCFAQWGTANSTPVSVIGNNVTFNALKGNYAAVINSNSGMNLTGTIDFINCTATSSANDYGVVLNASGGYVRFYGDGSQMSFSNNRTSSTTGPNRGDIKATQYVTFEDAGVYSLDGGITAPTLNILNGAQVSLLSGSVTKLTQLNIDTDSRLNLIVNDNNYVSTGATAFNSGATQFSVGTASDAVVVTGSGLCPITVDCTGLSVKSSDLLVMLGNTSGIQKPIIQSTGLTNALVFLRSSDDKGLRLGVQELIGGSTIYRYSSAGTLSAHGTDLGTIGMANGDRIVLTGNATNSASVNNNGKTITIQSYNDTIFRIDATGTKRFFDYGNGTYNLSNVELYHAGTTETGHDMGSIIQHGNDNANVVKIHANNVKITDNQGRYAAFVNSSSGLILDGTIDVSGCLTRADNSGLGVAIQSSGSVGGYVLFQGDGSRATFSNNRRTDGSRNDIIASRYVTFTDKGTYSFDGGIIAPTLNVQNGAIVSLEPGSVNKSTTGINVINGSDLTVGGSMTAGAIAVSDKSSLRFSAATTATANSIVLDADSMVSIAVTDGNIVSAGNRTYGTGATNVSASQWTMGTIGTQTTFMVDPSTVSTAPTTGQEVLVTQSDLSAYQANGNRIVIQTAPNDKYLAYLNTVDSTGLTVGLKAKEASKGVYLQKTDGTWTSGASFQNYVADEVITYVDANLTAGVQNLGNTGATVMRTYAIQSTSDAVRRLDASGQVRFFDWASGDWTISNIEFYGAGRGDQGSVFQNGDTCKVPVNLYARNVSGTNLTGTFGAFIHSFPGTNLTGTLTVSGCRTTSTGSGVAIHVGNAYTARFYGDSSDMLFTDNKWTNGTPNDIKAGTVLFEDAGKYQFDSGIVAQTITASDSSRVTLGASSQSTTATLNLQDTATLKILSGAAATANALNVSNSPTIDGDLTVGATGIGLVAKALNLGSDTDPGALTVLGDYTQSTDVVLDVFSTESTDKLYFGGNAEFLNDAQLIVRNTGGLVIDSTELTLLDGANESALNEAYAHLDLSDFGEQIRWSSSLDALPDGGYQLTLHGANSESVPEPASCVLLLLGAFGLYFGMSRNKRRI